MLRLRKAEMSDWARLYRWRMDPGTRAGALSPESFSVGEHVTWLQATLAAPERVQLYVAYDDERSAYVGTARLDLHEPGAAPAAQRAKSKPRSAADVRVQRFADVSVTVDPLQRGRGYGTQLVLALDAEARGCGVTRLLAQIKTSNVASLCTFADAGYVVSSPGAATGEVVTMEKTL